MVGGREAGGCRRYSSSRFTRGREVAAAVAGVAGGAANSTGETAAAAAAAATGP